MNDSRDSRKFAGFWIRFLAFVLDNMILLGVITIALQFLYGSNFSDWTMGSGARTDMNRSIFFLNWVLPAIYSIGFWIFKSATIGKMLVKTKIMHVRPEEAVSVLQFIVRFIGYFVSAIPLGLGFFWIAFDKKNQGWHDKISRTVVVRI